VEAPTQGTGMVVEPLVGAVGSEHLRSRALGRAGTGLFLLLVDTQVSSLWSLTIRERMVSLHLSCLFRSLALIPSQKNQSPASAPLPTTVCRTVGESTSHLCREIMGKHFCVFCMVLEVELSSWAATWLEKREGVCLESWRWGG